MNPPDTFHPAERRPAATNVDAVLDRLNEQQRRAVVHPGGSQLVLAGAGSGKTRVITHRIAHLVLAGGVNPSRIVAVTFTNKAAAEMRERVETLLGHDGLGCWIGTFHALCLRILRRDGQRIGLDRDFTIYDTDDQLALVKRILKEHADEGSAGTPRSFLSRISRAKNALESVSEMEKRAFNPERKLVAEIYRRYSEALDQAHAVDFDDLLLKALRLFNEHPDVARDYSGRCEHLLVDEYQDTNRPQYLLIRHLSAVHGNICVVGDEDQSIYRFRGADIRNILEFENDHADTCTIRLEQNYRSTATILKAASAVIANNLNRKGKTLWTANSDGEKLELFHAPDDRNEAVWVAQRVGSLETTLTYEGIAVLYRTNAQSRLIEEIFRRDRVPYQIVGSVQFYERKEIKDLLAYLKLAANPSDDVAFRRVLNTPARGIGNTTLRAIESVARSMGLPRMEAAGHALEQGLLATRSASKLGAFLDFLADLSAREEADPVAVLLQHVIDATEYEAYLQRAFPGQGSERMENVRALVSAAAEYAEETDDGNLRGFLDRSALASPADDVGQRPGVTLMTIHCAKGLEFPAVFLVGLEENLFPHAMCNESPEDIEEERRLCHVAMTRARERLFLSHAALRRIQGALIPNPPSRFLDEVPPDAIEQVRPADCDFLEEIAHDGGFGARLRNGSSAARANRRSSPLPTPKRPVERGPDPGDGFAVGADVQHPRFGGGQIVGREGSGKHLKLTIHFLNYGSKKILPAYTKLRVQTG